MKIVLVDLGLGPDSFNTFGKSHWSSVIHHGLCSIGAYAKAQGHEVSLVDLRGLKDWEGFRRQIELRRPSVVGISIRSWDYPTALKAAGIIKGVDGAITVVAGGVHPTVATAEVAACEDIDHIVVGEGEVSFAELLANLEAGKPAPRVIQGVSPDLDSLPFEDRTLYDYRVSASLPSYPGFFKAPMVTIIGSRGCPFNCRFCQPVPRRIFGKSVRYRSVDHVIEELKLLRERYHFSSFKAYDDCFTANRFWVEEFCEQYQRNGFNQEFLVQTRADIVCRQEALIKTLAESGLKMVIIGFESGSQRILDFVGKGTTVEENIRAAEICHRLGILVVGNFMLGVPTETKDETLATVEMARRIRPTVASVSYYTPIPGDDLYEYCVQNDLSLLKDHSDLVRFGNQPKIRGIDYDFLDRATEEIVTSAVGGRLLGKLAKALYVGTRHNLWLRHRLVQAYGLVFGRGR